VHRAQYASLLDDPFFAIELDQIDLPIDEELVAAVTAQEESRRRFAEQPESADDNEPIGDEPVDSAVASAAGAIALRVAGFVVMMTVGGAAAALVFADRVALLLAK
jgi:hypothetical protein